MRLSKEMAVMGIGAVVALFVFGPAHAQNRNEVFFGTYALSVDYDNNFARDDFAGFHIGYSRDFTDHFGFRGSAYFMEHDDVSGLDVSGVDLAMVGGLLGDGFNVFGGGGLFTEEWDLSRGGSEDFSGIQLVLGIGYNWDRVGLDFTIAGRSTSDYEDFIQSRTGANVDATAGTANLNVGFRF